MKTNYLKYKQATIQEAIDWQLNFASHSYSYYELYEIQENFYKKAKRYGLLREFRNEGIL